MKNIIPICAVLFVLGAFSLHAQAQNIESEELGNIKALISTLDANVAAYRELNGKIASVTESERLQLLYRQDERVFEVLADYDNLAGLVAGLPEGSTEKQEYTQYLEGLGKGSLSDMDKELFARIDEIQQLIEDGNSRIKELGGVEFVTTQAYVQGMESIRIKYFEALASHVQSRTRLGLSADALREQLDSRVYLYAESLVGRIEYTGVARSRLQEHLSQFPENADILLASKALESRHETDLQKMEAVIGVLDILGTDSSSYQAVMLRHASSISVSFFSANAIVTVLKDGWSALKEAMKRNAPDLVFRLLLFVIVLLVFRTLSRLTKRVVRAAVDKSRTDMSVLLKNILVSTSGGVVMALGVLMALSQVGISLGPMLAGLGVAGFIVGFALQDSLGNFASGAMILAYRPFDVGDLVSVTGASGLVKKMNLVSTTIVTLDNQTLVVPNSKIWGDVIKNVTAQKKRRVDIEFGIGYSDDSDHAERIMNGIVDAHENILTDPPPVVRMHTLGESSVNFIVRAWTRTEDYWDVYWDLIRGVKHAFDREGISIPFPQRDVHLYTQED